MTFPTVTTSIELTPGVWTDISDYVIQIDINRGRSRDLEQFQAGTVTYRLDNSDGRFNPLNTSSPYYPNVKPNKRIRTRVGYKAAVEAMGPLAYWRLGEAAGATTAVDEMGSFDLTKNGNPTFGVDGRIPGNTAVEFFGNTADHLSTTAFTPALTGNVTMAAWFKRDALVNGRFIGKGGTDFGDWGAGATATSQVSWFFVDTGGAVQQLFSAGGLVAELNRWYFFVGTWDGTFLRIYLDGVLIATSANLSAFTPIDAGDILRVGRRFDASEPWDGIIDEPAIWDRALTEAEIKYLYDTGTAEIIDSPRFQGFIDSWPITWKKELSEVEVRATDGFKALQQVKLENPYVGEVLADSPKAYYRLNESSGTVATDSSGNGHNGEYLGAPTFSQTDPITDEQDGAVSFDGVDDRISLPSVVSPATTSFSLEAWVKTPAADETGYRFIFGHFEWQLYVASAPFDNDGKVYLFRDGVAMVASAVSVADNQWYHVVATYNGTTARIYLNGSLSNSANITLPVSQSSFFIGADYNGSRNFYKGAIDEAAVYDSTLSATRISAHYNTRTAWLSDTGGTRIGKVLDKAKWPTADRTLDTGNTTLQSAGDLEGQMVLEHIQKVAESELGAFYITKDGKARFRERHAILKSPYTVSQATFGDTGSDLPYQDPTLEYDETEIRNDVSVSRRNGTPQKASDSTSIDTYGIRSYSKTGFLMNSDSDALGYAQTVRERFKDPLLRVTSITLTPESEASLWTAYLSRELEDRVTVKGTPPGTGGAINEEAHIQGIRETIGPTPRWRASLYLSKADTQVYWLAGVVGRSEAGVTTRAGWALTPLPLLLAAQPLLDSPAFFANPLRMTMFVGVIAGVLWGVRMACMALGFGNKRILFSKCLPAGFVVNLPASLTDPVSLGRGMRVLRAKGMSSYAVSFARSSCRRSAPSEDVLPMGGGS